MPIKTGTENWKGTMSVLVVDDESISRETVAKALRDGGYDVVTATDGEAAFELIRSRHFPIVVTDLSMPRMCGIELCQRIRSMRSRPYVYFIIVTGHDGPFVQVSGFAEGIDDYIVKPFDAWALLMRVEAGRRVVQLETADMTIAALAKLSESRDPDAGSHLENIRHYCVSLANYLQTLPQFAESVDDEFIDLLERTCPLHDIGKVAIPDRILLKPGPLTEEEFEVMKTHTVRGAETIESVLRDYPHASFLRFARDLILTHHEKWDGSGYPLGLSGEAIPLCGRIMAIADVYDALTSKRVYKEAYCHEKAKSIIVRDAGSHFDPVLVDAFLQVEQDFRSIGLRNLAWRSSRPRRLEFGPLPGPPESRTFDDSVPLASQPTGEQNV